MKNPRFAISLEIHNEPVRQETDVRGIFGSRGMILVHAVPQGQTVDAAYYTKVLPTMHVLSFKHKILHEINLKRRKF